MLGQPLSSVREEASLFTVGGKEEEEEEEEKSSSSTSISVELGEDPLTQAGEGVGGNDGVREMVGQYMSLQDQQNIRSLVKEFVSHLLPYLEAVLRKKNESVSFLFFSSFSFYSLSSSPFFSFCYFLHVFSFVSFKESVL